MTDKELLEAAARSAGISVDWRGECLCYSASPYNVAWNPLTDDGDALRLAIKLGIEIGFTSVRVWAVQPYMSIREEEQITRNSDFYDATRRAIVRAAASDYFNKGN